MDQIDTLLGRYSTNLYLQGASAICLTQMNYQVPSGQTEENLGSIYKLFSQYY